MTSVAIYVEGGGHPKGGQAALREGFDRLLSKQKEAARQRRMRWKTVLCGGRSEAYAAFVNATVKKTDDFVALVVDAEGPVAKSTPEGRVVHLVRQDGWGLERFDPTGIHLMTQCMEAWLVADSEVLAQFYGKAFRSKALPTNPILDEVSKPALYDALKVATKDTQKGRYGKIQHASELLKRVRPDEVSARCISFRQFVDWLDSTIARA